MDWEAEKKHLRRMVSDLTLDKLVLAEVAKGKLLSPCRRRAGVDLLMTEIGISERRACGALGQYRSTQRKISMKSDDEVVLTADIIDLARQYSRYGYRRIPGSNSGEAGRSNVVM